jgi:hypothetical protein
MGEDERPRQIFVIRLSSLVKAVCHSFLQNITSLPCPGVFSRKELTVARGHRTNFFGRAAGYNAKVSGQTSEVSKTSEVYAFTDSSALYPVLPGTGPVGFLAIGSDSRIQTQIEHNVDLAWIHIHRT